MDAQPNRMSGGLGLLIAHLRSLDPHTPAARVRLEARLGPHLTRKLLFALSPGQRRRAA
jgi:hypothetical protein